MHSLFLMEETFFGKWYNQKISAQNNASIVERILKMQVDDLDAQYKRMFEVVDRTARIKITGPLSPNGPDAWDIYFGHYGTAYLNIVRAAGEAKLMAEQGIIEKVEIIMNTPGGTLDGLEEAYAALSEINDMTTVYNCGMIASAGYWLACASKKIVTKKQNKASLTGSIGVVTTVYDVSDRMEKMGVKEIVITNTESPDKRPNLKTDEGIGIIRDRLDAIYNVFSSVVSASRGISVEQINALKGVVLISEDAIKAGLIDPMETDETSDTSLQDQEPEDDEPMEEVEEDGEDDDEEDEKTDMEENMIDKTTYSADQLKECIKAERDRIAELCLLGGHQLSEELKTAIETGATSGEFAVKMKQAELAQEDLKLEAERKLRNENKGTQTSISADQQYEEGSDPESGSDTASDKKVDNLVDEFLKEDGGTV